MKLRKKFKTSLNGAKLCNAIASFVAHFINSNGNHYFSSNITGWNACT